MEFNFKEDIRDLRSIILIFLIPFILSFSIFLFFSNKLIGIIFKYNSININDLILLTPLESIQSQIYVSLILSLTICIPLIIVGMYKFCKPILNPEIIKSTKMYVYSSILLSWTGFIFGATIFSTYLIKSLKYYQITNSMWSVKSVLSLILSFGISFSLIFLIIILIPLIINFKLITREKLIKSSIWIFLIITIISAVITPPDIISQLIVSIPFFASFWIGIIINKIQEVKNDRIK